MENGMDVLKWIHERWGSQTSLKAIRDLHSGMVVGENVRHEGALILKKGVSLNDGLIDSLTQKGIAHIAVVAATAPPSESRLAEMEASLMQRFAGHEQNATMKTLKDAMLDAYRDGVYE
jgi:hypothetical protein